MGRSLSVVGGWNFHRTGLDRPAIGAWVGVVAHAAIATSATLARIPSRVECGGLASPAWGAGLLGEGCFSALKNAGRTGGEATLFGGAVSVGTVPHLTQGDA